MTGNWISSAGADSFLVPLESVRSVIMIDKNDGKKSHPPPLSTTYSVSRRINNPDSGQAQSF